MRRIPVILSFSFVLGGLAFGGLAVAAPAPGTFANVAVGKPTRQSSTNFGGVAARAVDGNTNGNFAAGSVTHNDGELGGWFEIDLGSPQSIDRVVLHNRTDCCGERLNDALVELATGPCDKPRDIAASRRVSGAGQVNALVFDPGATAARYVCLRHDRRAAYLSLAEVQVFSPVSNIAVGKPARQSSTNFSGVAGRAVDGNTDGNFAAGSVTHNDGELGGWFEIDLGSPQPIDRVVVHNRTDCCGERLNDALVELATGPCDKPREIVGSRRVSGAGQVNSLAFDWGPTARYVCLRHDRRPAYLSLAEVQVFPSTLPPLDRERARAFGDPGLEVAPEGDFNKAVSSHMYALAWDGSRWKMGLHGDEFFVAPGGRLAEGRIDATIKYLAPDGSKWAARAQGPKFLLAPDGDFTRAQTADAIRFRAWDNSAGQARRAPPLAVMPEMPPYSELTKTKEGGLQSVTLWKDVGLGGRSVTLTADVSNFKDIDFNDAASSLRVNAGPVAVYQHKDYQGRCMTVRGEIRRLTGTTIGNDTISSLRMNHTCEGEVVVKVENATWSSVELSIGSVFVPDQRKWIAKGESLSIRVPLGSLVYYDVHRIELIAFVPFPNAADDGSGRGALPADRNRTYYIVEAGESWGKPENSDPDRWGLGASGDKPWYHQ